MDVTGKKILVVDDEQDLSDLLRIHLEEAGFIVDTAIDGKSAKNKVLSYIPDLVILDIGLPDIDGIDLCGWFKKQVLLTDIPIIFLSVQTLGKVKIDGLEAGAEDYINKPYNPAELVLRIKKILFRRNKELPNIEKASITLTKDELALIYYWAEEATNEFFILTEKEKVLIDKINKAK